MAAAPELIPEAVTLGEALAALGTLTACLFILGVLKVSETFVRVLFGTATRAVGWIPWAGHVLTAPIHKIEQKISNGLGAAELKIDGYIANSWHRLGQLVRMVARELEGLAWDMLLLAAGLVELWKPKTIRAFIHALLNPIETAQRIYDALMRGARASIAAVRQMVVEGVYPRLRGAEHAIEDVLTPDIAALRTRARAIEDRLAKLRAWTKRHERVVATGVFVAAVAFALRRLELGWLRCRNVRKAGRFLCGLPAGLLDDILGLALIGLVVVKPRDVAKLAIEATEQMESIIVKIAEAAD